MSTWIDVLNQMPDDDTMVLVATADGDVWCGYHDGDDGWRLSDGSIVDVTHWQYMPEPPHEQA